MVYIWYSKIWYGTISGTCVNKSSGTISGTCVNKSSGTISGTCVNKSSGTISCAISACSIRCMVYFMI